VSQSESRFVWTLRSFVSLNSTAVESPVFKYRRSEFRILVFPYGHDLSSKHENASISVFLLYPTAQFFNPDTKSEEEFSFEFKLLNSIDPSNFISAKLAKPHTFTKDRPDWGFSEFVGRDVILAPKSGLLQDGALVFEVSFAEE